MKAASGRLLVVVPIALGLLFVMLYMTFGSAGLAGLIYLNVPFAVTGGVSPSPCAACRCPSRPGSASSRGSASRCSTGWCWSAPSPSAERRD